MKSTRRLVVNADDFGFTRDVNEGVVEAHRNGVLTATTLMANGDAFEHAGRLARENPALDVGCHLVLVQGNSLLAPYRAFPPTVAALIAALAARRIRIYDELAAQVRRILDAGVKPTHLDTHKHTHLLPSVLDAVARIAEEYRIPWVRRPFDFPFQGVPSGVPRLRRCISRGFHLMRRRFHRVLERHGCRMTDHFAGFRIEGRFRTEALVALIRQLPEGSTELMCHPGHCGSELRAARTRLKGSRQQELEALVAPETRRALEDAGVDLVNYKDL